jgi:hypothetical protein
MALSKTTQDAVLQKIKLTVQEFLRSNPNTDAAINDFIRKHNNLWFALVPIARDCGMTDNEKACQQQFKDYYVAVRPQFNAHLFKQVVAAVRTMGPRVNHGGQDWAIQLWLSQQDPKWKGPKTDLLPVIAQANANRISAVQKNYTPSGYQISTCVASQQPLPPKNKKLGITYLFRADRKVYVRCFLKTSIASIRQGYSQFQLYGEVHFDGGRLPGDGEHKFPVDIAVNPKRSYFDYSFDLNQLRGENRQGRIKVGFGYRYFDSSSQQYQQPGWYYDMFFSS